MELEQEGQEHWSAATKDFSERQRGAVRGAAMIRDAFQNELTIADQIWRFVGDRLGVALHGGDKG